MYLSLHSGFDMRALSLLLSLVVDSAAVAVCTRMLTLAFQLVEQQGRGYFQHYHLHRHEFQGG